jgi:hypothetical protein
MLRGMSRILAIIGSYRKHGTVDQAAEDRGKGPQNRVQNRVSFPRGPCQAHSCGLLCFLIIWAYTGKEVVR